MLNRSMMMRTVVSALALCAFTSHLDAQACFGLAPRGGVAYENVRFSVGTGHGASAGVATGPIALGVTGRTIKINSVAKGYEGGFRIAGIVPIKRVQLCPGIGANYHHDDWTTPTQSKLTTDQLSLRAGAAFGLNQHIYKGISVIPSVGLHYQFDVYKFDVKSSTANDVETTGDTVSHVAIDYGIAVRYKFMYGGVAATRFSDASGIRPSIARYIIGFAFGMPGGKRRED